METLTTFKEWFLYFVGPYVPDNTEGLQGIAQLDIPWIAGAVLIIALCIFFFKAIKSILSDLFRGWFV